MAGARSTEVRVGLMIVLFNKPPENPDVCHPRCVLYNSKELGVYT